MGIVSNPAGHWIEVRLKNQDSEQLRRASTRLVHDLGRGLGFLSAARRQHAVTFDERIEVLAPHSDSFAFFGRIRDGSPWAVTRRERLPEVTIVAFSIALGVVLLYLTSPASVWQPGADPGGLWLEGNLERLTSAAIFAGIVAAIQVVLRYLEVRRSPVVQWY